MIFKADNWRFFFSWLRAPRKVASAIPSSRALGRRMASAVEVAADELVVELGGGTGAITGELLASGIPAERLVVFEQNATFADLLRERFPGITVLNDDAQVLADALQAAGHNRPVGSIVSSLPLLTLPIAVRDRILGQCRTVLVPEGSFVQFTYGIRSPVPEEVQAKLGFSSEQIGSVWSNLPPATVWCYRPLQALAATA
ncbi:MAG: methyltransferase [Gammaproteobacteria bacterium]|nr:methyltransferase [Gammaproteobacteria bacterium]